MATRGIEPSFGLLFNDILTDLNVGTAGAAIIISGLDVMMNMSGLFVGPFLKKFSYRKVAFGGSLLCALGLVLTSFASSMLHIICTYSIVNGIGKYLFCIFTNSLSQISTGVGLATSAAFVALNHYFTRKRGQAVGLSMAGTALGMLILPQLISICLEAYGFRGTLQVLGALALHAALGATLLQPAKWHMKEEKIDIELLEPIPEETSPPKITTIDENEDEEELPEMNTLLFNNKSVGKRLHDVQSNNSPGIMTKRPTFPRITSSINEYSSGLNNSGSFRNNAPTSMTSFPRITSVVSMSNEVRRRKESVLSVLSTFDFSGSGMIHLNMDVSTKNFILRRKLYEKLSF